MAWNNFWKSKPVETTSSALSVFDFPKSEYKVYWEIHLGQQPDATWTAEVRFIGNDQWKIRDSHNVYGPTKDNVEKLVEKLIREKMPSYRK